MSKRVLLVAATTGYQTRVFAEAGRSLGVEMILATDRCRTLEDPWGDQALPVRFETPEKSAAKLAGTHRFDAVAAVGDKPALVAAHIAWKLGLPFHTPAAVESARNKFLSRERFRAAGLPVPEFFRTGLEAGEEASRQARYPCVLKPLGLSASRGVIKAGNAGEFVAAFRRIREILKRREIARHRDLTDQFIQVETFIPGREFALEGLVTAGRLQALALFDKPDPMDGPYFEETIYVTPSRAPAGVQASILEAAQRAVNALGLTFGPVHAEMRVNDGGVWMLEVAPRPIGGLCARALKFEGDASLEQVILRHALGGEIREMRLGDPATGVMMIPAPGKGIFESVQGVEEAAGVPGITGVEITAKQGQLLEPLPEGNSYTGFLFAAGEAPEAVEASLRRAHACLRFEMRRVLAWV